MKNSQSKLLIVAGKILVVLLGLFGFTACPLCAYGTPVIEYKITGTVIDETGNPINGIEITATVGYDPEAPHHKVVFYSSYEGLFRCPYIINGSGGLIKLTFHDIDGEENGGEFADKEVYTQDLNVTDSKHNGEWETRYNTDTVVQLEKK